MQIENLKIRRAEQSDIQALEALALSMGASKDVDYFATQLEFHQAGKRILYIAHIAQEIVGYCVLNWTPKYSFFKTMGYPEIQDLNVSSEYRKHGIATAMIKRCEEAALEKRLSHMGIGVGMDRSFGAAQRLYVKLGYIPDGNGVTYDRQLLASGEFRPIDGELCLMMVKAL